MPWMWKRGDTKHWHQAGALVNWFNIETPGEWLQILQKLEDKIQVLSLLMWYC
jgi:hypothetical protein